MTPTLETLADHNLDEFFTIVFAHPKTEEAMDRMFSVVGESMGVQIIYTIEKSKLTGPWYGDIKSKGEIRGPSIRGLKIAGNITPMLDKRPQGPTMEVFNCKKRDPRGDPTTVDLLEFQQIPDYEVNDYRGRGTLELIQETRQAIEAYERGDLD